MRWLEVCGPPGVGKSALCDPLWLPRAIEWDGQAHPREWQAFLAATERLLHRIRAHPSYATCESMVARSLRKIATVSRHPGPGVYIQTGLAQRGLGIGWRLGADVEAVADYYRLMPVSLGVAFLVAPVEEVQRRNASRRPVKDRGWMVPLMERPREIAVEVLRARGVPVIELDMMDPPNVNRDRLICSAGELAAAA
jgi:hypothetical protein